VAVLGDDTEQVFLGLVGLVCGVDVPLVVGLEL
jgi:hypothetical protein